MERYYENAARCVIHATLNDHAESATPCTELVQFSTKCVRNVAEFACASLQRELDEAREEIERLTGERDGWKNMAESLNRGELRAFLDEVRPVLLWVCKTPGFGKWEDLARTLIGRWPK